MEIRRDLTQQRGPYRSYSADDLADAFNAVVSNGLPVERAAKNYGVPITTLKDRVKGRVDIDTIKSGPQPLFNLQQEKMLVDHISTMAEVGYGYSRQETINLATDFAIHLGIRDPKHPLSLQWLHSFLSRWPDLKVRKPRNLEIARAKSATESVISKYFCELKSILDKFNLNDHPERIYNIDEKGLSLSHKPPRIVSSSGYKAQAVTAGKSKTVTLIGCVNAVGQQVPPFFIFPGQRMLDSLLDGASPGVSGTVSESGWSNTDIFQRYMTEHLIKYLPERDQNHNVLVLYDGHKSHVSLPLIQWAKQNNITLFVLPPHCSHLLQPLDVCCFGPFETTWNTTCHRRLRETGGTVMTRYDVCSLACKVYIATLTVATIQTAFKRCGIYPYNASIISPSALAPSTSFAINATKQHHNASKNPVNEKSTDNGEHFLEKKGGKILENVKMAVVRNTLSKVVGGKAITEDKVVEAIVNHSTVQSKRSKRRHHNTTELTPKKVKKFRTPFKPKAGPSKVTPKPPTVTNKVTEYEDEDSEDSQIQDSEKCVVCHQFTPKDIDKKPYLVIVNWGCCDKCQGWVHLTFCTKERVLRRGDPFFCPGCKPKN